MPYKNVTAVCAESDDMCAVFLPHCGGKMSGLFDKHSGRELLVQDDRAYFAMPDFQSKYTKNYCFGFDDMFPNIDECVYDRQPFANTQLLDHGEVCRSRWDFDFSADGISMTVNGTLLPYTITKTIQFDSRALHIRYIIRNLSECELDYIYAAHFMLMTVDGAKLELYSPSKLQGRCVFSANKGFLNEGEIFDWPIEGKNHAAQNYKFYFTEPMTPRKVSYTYPDARCFTMQYDLSYFGIWVNDGLFNNLNSITLEPCSATNDSPDRARKMNQYSVLAPHGTAELNLSFTLTQIDERMNNDDRQ